MSKACPSCNSTATAIAFEKCDLSMSRCRSCGFVYTTQPPSWGSARYAQEWFEREYLPSFGINPASPRTEHLNERFDADLELIEKYARKGTLLDVGAGAGLFLNRAKQRGWTVEGVEPAGYGVQFAKTHFDITIHQCNLEDAPFSPGIFDAIILQDVIEHVPEPKALLSNVGTLLKRGGVILVTTPNYSSLARKMYQSNWSLISPAEHLSLFDPGNLSRLYKSVGLSSKVMTTTTRINEASFHFADQPWLKLRRAVLKRLRRMLPEGLISMSHLGDEIISVAQKA